MPVEIRELHIRVAVNPGPATQNAGPAIAAQAADSSNGSDKDAIVAECVEQVMQIIQSKKDR